MTIALYSKFEVDGTASTRPRLVLSSGTARTLLSVGIVGSVAVAFLVTGMKSSIATVDPDLTHLLRFMAALKAGMAAVAVAAIVWRLGSAIVLGRLAAYGLACGMMAAGPVLIWSMMHVGSGALLLHGGLLASVLLLWRDPVVARRLATAIASRTALRAARQAKPYDVSATAAGAPTALPSTADL